MLESLPAELQRRILLMNRPSVMVRSSLASRSLYGLNLRALLLPSFLEGMTDIDRQPDNAMATRMIHNRAVSSHRKNLSAYYGKPAFVVHAEFLQDKISYLVGDRAKFDSPSNRLRRSKDSVNWKMLGYLGLEDFEASMPTPTQRNLACTFLQFDAPGWMLY